MKQKSVHLKVNNRLYLALYCTSGILLLKCVILVDHLSLDQYNLKSVIHRVLLTRKSNSGRLTKGGHEAAMACQPTANPRTPDIRRKRDFRKNAVENGL